MVAVGEGGRRGEEVGLPVEGQGLVRESGD